MEKKEVLLIAGNYPHTLMQHMNTLVKERGAPEISAEGIIRCVCGHWGSSA